MDDINFDEEPKDIDFGPSSKDLNTQQMREVRRSWQNVTKKRGDIKKEYARLEKLGIDPGHLDNEISAQDVLPKGSSTERARAGARDAAAFGRGVVQGATFEFADEGLAAARSALTGESYDKALEEERKSLADLEKRPGYTGGNIVGAMAGPGAATARGLQTAYNAARGVVPRTAAALGIGTAAGGTNELGRQKEKDVAGAYTSVPAIAEGALTATAPVATSVATAARPYVQSAISRAEQVFRLPRVVRNNANRIANQPAGQIPANPRTYRGGDRAQEVAARRTAAELDAAGMPTERAATYRAAGQDVGNMQQAESAPFLTVAPNSTINRFVKNAQLSPRSGEGMYKQTVRDIVEPHGRGLGERVATQFKREAGVTALPEDVILASRQRIRGLYDDIQAVREQAGGTFVPGLGGAFKRSGIEGERIYNRAAKKMSIEGPGKVDFEDPKFPTFGREYQRRLRAYNAQKRAAVQQAAAAGQNPRRAAQLFDADNKHLKPVLLNDKNLPTTVMMELYNDATALAAKGDTVGMRVLDTFKQNLPGAASGSWLGRFRDAIEDLRISKSSQLDEGMEAVGAGGTAAGPKTRVEFREMTPEQQAAFREGMVLEQGERLRNQIDVNPNTGVKDIVQTPTQVDTYNEVVRGPQGSGGMSANELRRQVSEVGRRQEIAQRIANARGGTALEDGGFGPAAEVMRKAAYSTSYAGVGAIDTLSKMVPEGTRQAENFLASQNIGGVYDAIRRVRAADEALRLRREASSIRNRAIANALISSQVKAPEE